MSSLSNPTGPTLARRYLTQATHSLAMGDIQMARRLAVQVLQHGRKSQNIHAQAQACLLLSQMDVLASDMKRAKELSCRAVTLFEQDDNPTGQAHALAVVSYSSSSLGQDQAAVEAATRGVMLRESTDSPVVQAFGYNYLGVASFWAGDLDSANRTLEAAVWFAQDFSDDPAHSFQPLVNSCFSEVLQVMHQESQGHPNDLSRLVKLLKSCETLLRSGHAGALNPAVSPVGLLLLAFANCFAWARIGLLDAAHRAYLECKEHARPMPATSWVHSVVEWAKFELAKASGDLPQAAIAVQLMKELAHRGQHEHVAAVADGLAATQAAQNAG